MNLILAFVTVVNICSASTDVGLTCSGGGKPSLSIPMDNVKLVAEKGDVGAVGPQGVKGEPGSPCQCSENDNLKSTILSLKTELSDLTLQVDSLKRLIKPNDCSEIVDGSDSDVRNIYPFGVEMPGVEVKCENDWTIIQSRTIDSGVSFDRTFAEYENGFGKAGLNHWVGLRYIHAMTSSGSYRLKVNVETKLGAWHSWDYTFKIGPRSDFYRLTVSQYSNRRFGGLSGFFSGPGQYQQPFEQFYSGQQFNVKGSGQPLLCGENVTGGWWRNDEFCDRGFLNGKRIIWPDYSTTVGLKSSVMMIKNEI